jgi:hypothetical protein
MSTQKKVNMFSSLLSTKQNIYIYVCVWVISDRYSRSIFMAVIALSYMYGQVLFAITGIIAHWFGEHY